MTDAEFETLEDEHNRLVTELTKVGARLGATAGIMPFVRPLLTQEADWKSYNEIWDRLGALRRKISN